MQRNLTDEETALRAYDTLCDEVEEVLDESLEKASSHIDVRSISNFHKQISLARNLAKKASEQIEVPEEMFEKSPFNLSGGQMRRVAIAGILASEPEILILDEPTVGLDPKGKDNLMNLLVNLQKETHKSIVMITHDMNAVARYSKRVIVMNKGDVVFDGTPQELFNN